jgi:hypothetical protein
MLGRLATSAASTRPAVGNPLPGRILGITRDYGIQLLKKFLTEIALKNRRAKCPVNNAGSLALFWEGMCRISDDVWLTLGKKLQGFRNGSLGFSKRIAGPLDRRCRRARQVAQGSGAITALSVEAVSMITVLPRTLCQTAAIR